MRLRHLNGEHAESCGEQRMPKAVLDDEIVQEQSDDEQPGDEDERGQLNVKKAATERVTRMLKRRRGFLGLGSYRNPVEIQIRMLRNEPETGAE